MVNAITLPFVLQLLSGDPSAPAGGSFDSAARDTLAARGPHAAIPPPAVLADVRETIGPHVMRLTTAAGSWIILRAEIDSSGVHALTQARSRPARGALIQLVAPPEPPPLPSVVPWSEIERIEVGRSQWRQGAAGGAFLWTIAAIASYPLASWLFSYTPEYPVAGLLLFGSLVALTGGGAALTASSKDWTVVWQPPGAAPWNPKPTRKR